MPDVLIVADTFRSPELRHELPAPIGDPILYAEVGGARHVMAPSHEAPIIAAAGDYHYHAPEEYGVEELRRTPLLLRRDVRGAHRPGGPVARDRAGARPGSLPRLRRRPAAGSGNRARDGSRVLHRSAPREVGGRARGDPARAGGGRRRDGACARGARGGRAGRRRDSRAQRRGGDERDAPRRDRRGVRLARRLRRRVRRLARPSDGDRPSPRRGPGPRRRAGDRRHLATGQQVCVLHRHDAYLRRRRARPRRSSNGTASASSGWSSRSGSFGPA